MIREMSAQIMAEGFLGSEAEWQWTETLANYRGGEGDSDDSAKAIVVNADGSYVIAGSTAAAYQADWYLVKIIVDY